MNNHVKEFVAEFLGTAILMMFGASGCASAVLTHNSSPFMAALSYGAGAIVAIFFCGPISGAHINPAITFALCVIRKCSWRKCPIYFLAQYLGAFVGFAVVYGLYFENMQALDAELNLANNSTGPSVTTASIFITLPAQHITIAPAIGDQVVSTALLIFAVLFIGDESCYRTPSAIQTLSVGFIIFAFVQGWGFNCGAILNPARDFAPRLLLYFLGYNRIVFEALEGHFWWAVGIVSPHIGAVIGATLYVMMAKMRNSYVESSHQLDTIVPPLNPERDLIYQKARIVINDNIKNIKTSPPHSRTSEGYTQY